MAESWQAILLMIALIIGGFLIVFNVIPGLGLGFSNIHNFVTGFWVILVKLVGLALIAVPGYVIVNIIRG